MELLLSLILVGFLVILFIQDFKNREISWFLIPLLFIGFTVKALFTIEVNELLLYFGINLLMVIINLLGVSLMVSIKEKKPINILNTYLGLGDVLFFLVITVAFSPLNFFVFFIGSVLLSSIVYGLMLLIKKEKQLPFPLAGAMSLMLIVTFLSEHFIASFQLYQDIILI